MKIYSVSAMLCLMMLLVVSSCVTAAAKENGAFQQYTIERPVPVTGINKIIIDNNKSASVVVNYYDGKEIMIRNEGSILDGIDPQLSISTNWWGDELTIKAGNQHYYPSADKTHSESSQRGQKLVVSLPQNYSGSVECIVESGDADIKANKLAGLVVKERYGNVKLDMVYGKNVNVVLEYGSINLNILSGEKLYVDRTYSAGNVPELIVAGDISELVSVKMNYGNDAKSKPPVRISLASIPNQFDIETFSQNISVSIGQMPVIYKLSAFSAFGALKQNLQSGKKTYENDQRQSLSQDDRKDAKQINISASHCDVEITDGK